MTHDFIAPKGPHFVFEGLDGSGKSTQCKMLVAALQDRGHHVVETREPTTGPWGQKIRQMAMSGQRVDPQEELAWFIADRKAHIDDVILPALNAGSVVIQDRYFFSTMAYQGSQGLDPQAILQAHAPFAPLPLRTFYLAIPAAVGLQRVQSRQGQPDAFEKLDALERCADIFDAMEHHTYGQLDGFMRFDAQLSPDEIHQQILTATLDALRDLRQ